MTKTRRTFHNLLNFISTHTAAQVGRIVVISLFIASITLSGCRDQTMKMKEHRPAVLYANAFP
jgi:hypothetical protein